MKQESNLINRLREKTKGVATMRNFADYIKYFSTKDSKIVGLVKKVVRDDKGLTQEEIDDLSIVLEVSDTRIKEVFGRDSLDLVVETVFVDDMGFESDRTTDRYVRREYMAAGNPANVIDTSDRASLDIALVGLSPILDMSEIGIAEDALFSGGDPRLAVEQHRAS